jgi:hypothetical protein
MITLFILPNFKAEKKIEWLSVTIQTLFIDALYIVPMILSYKN